MKCRQNIYIPFLSYNILTAIVELFFSNLIFYVLCELFPNYPRFNETVAGYWKHLSSLLMDLLLLFCFSFNQENHHVSDLFYDICNRTNQHNPRKKSLPFIDSLKPVWYLERSNHVSDLFYDICKRTN